MPEREKFIEQEVKRTHIVKEGDKWVQKEISITESVPIFEDVDLYNEDGDVIGIHQVAVLESYEEEEEESEEEEEEE